MHSSSELRTLKSLPAPVVELTFSMSTLQTQISIPLEPVFQNLGSGMSGPGSSNWSECWVFNFLLGRDMLKKLQQFLKNISTFLVLWHDIGLDKGDTVRLLYSTQGWKISIQCWLSYGSENDPESILFHIFLLFEARLYHSYDCQPQNEPR